MAERVLVTGGSGFIGSHLVDRLLEQGHRVTVYDIAPPRQESVTFIQGDMRVAEGLPRALDGQDVVFHFAANADVRGGTSAPTRDLEQNFFATQLLLAHMVQAGVPLIVFASSSAVYGEPTMFPTPEDAPFPVQTSLYGASKVAAEALVSAYCYGFGLQATIFRFAPVLGERYRHGHVFDFYQKLTADPTRIMVLGDGKQRKSYVYVHDVMDGIQHGLGVPFRTGEPVHVFNIGGETALSVNESLAVICACLGVDPVRDYTGGERGWPGDPPLIWLDCTRLRATGWTPKVAVQDAIMRTVRSFPVTLAIR